MYIYVVSYNVLHGKATDEPS